jgi:hypothetical protein
MVYVTVKKDKIEEGKKILVAPGEYEDLVNFLDVNDYENVKLEYELKTIGLFGYVEGRLDYDKSDNYLYIQTNDTIINVPVNDVSHAQKFGFGREKLGVELVMKDKTKITIEKI